MWVEWVHFFRKFIGRFCNGTGVAWAIRCKMSLKFYNLDVFLTVIHSTCNIRSDQAVSRYVCIYRYICVHVIVTYDSCADSSDVLSYIRAGCDLTIEVRKRHFVKLFHCLTRLIHNTQKYTYHAFNLILLSSSNNVWSLRIKNQNFDAA